jgi:organic hydroperoxide reductase OsmC/OhrA
VLEEIAPGRHAITKVTLRPKIDWAGPAPQKEALDRLHHEAHDICFIANSVRTQVTVE